MQGRHDPPEEDKGVVTAAQAATVGETVPARQPYTIFTVAEQRLITVIMGMSMFFSPMTANVYFPVMPALASAMNVSIQKINITITAYIILQGISPLFVGDLADKVGRRPVYLLTFLVYISASLGLALNRSSYAALLALRTLQSAGCSATAAISYGVLADVATPAKRGHMLGMAMVVANTGPTLGPLLGGVIADRCGWNWVFWFLTILGAAFLLALVILLPETSRKIVNNGSIPASRWNRPMLSLLAKYPRNTDSKISLSSPASANTPLTFPNPLPALRIVLQKDASLVLWISAIHYMAYYCLQATMPDLFATRYDLDELQIGLTYLSIGLGVACGGFLNGKFMDVNYRRTARDIHFTIDHVVGDDIRLFPIERARTRFAQPLIVLDAFLLIAYGWGCRYHAHLAIMLVLQFTLGLLQTCIVQTFNTLLVDIFPTNPSTASASGNITRCALSAAGIAAIQPLLEQLDYGWVFTLLAVLAGVTCISATALIRSKGMVWRQERSK